MKNIYLFIRQYFNFLSFLLLQILCIVMLSNASKTHETYFSGITFEVTGYFNKHYANLQQYFQLKETNQRLAAENSRLRNALTSNFVSPDTTALQITDSTFRDTLGRNRKFIYLPAKVIGNSYTLQNNYLMLERGENQGIKKGMAVVGPDGIVGVVVDVSANLSKVMSLLHRNSKVSAMLKKDNTTGSIEWDGADPSLLILRNVSKSAKVLKGDTVLTSTYSANFPSHLMIGRVASITEDPATNYYTLKIKTATNFFTVQDVDVIYNTRYNEQIELENRNKNQ